MLSPSRAPGKVTVKAVVSMSTRVGFMAVHLAVTRRMFAVIKQTNETLHTQLPLPPKQCQPNVFHSWAPLPERSPTLYPWLIQMACGCWEPTAMGNGLFHNLLQTLSLTANRLETFSNRELLPIKQQTVVASALLLFNPSPVSLAPLLGKQKVMPTCTLLEMPPVTCMLGEQESHCSPSNQATPVVHIWCSDCQPAARGERCC